MNAKSIGQPAQLAVTRAEHSQLAVARGKPWRRSELFSEHAQLDVAPLLHAKLAEARAAAVTRASTHAGDVDICMYICVCICKCM